MSTVTTHTTESRDSHSVGLCKFNTTTKAFEISDGTDWYIYDTEGSVAGRFPNNSYSGYFDGTNSYAIIPTISELNAPSALSTSMWFNCHNFSSNRCLFSAGSSSSNNFFIQLNGASMIRYGIGGSVVDTTTVSLSANTWYNLITVQNGTALEIFLNGSSVKTATTTAPGSGAGTNFKIGTYNIGGVGPASFFQGNIDEFAIYNTALSSSEVSSIYNDNALADRVALWRFENDFTDNEGSYDGTNNGVTFSAKADDPTNTPY